MRCWPRLWNGPFHSVRLPPSTRAAPAHALRRPAQPTAGYEGIDALRGEVEATDAALAAAKAQLRAAKAEYDARLAEQSSVHR